MEKESLKLNKLTVKNKTEEEEIQHENQLNFNWIEFLACLSVATTNLHTGCALGFSAILLPQLENIDEVGQLSKSQHSWIVAKMSSDEEAVISMWYSFSCTICLDHPVIFIIKIIFLCLHIASSISIAAPFGCLFIAFTLDRIGRICTFKISLWPCAIGWLLIAVAYCPHMIIIGRLLNGFAMSIGTNSANVYMAEISNPKLRGFMMSIGSIILSFGILLMYATGLFFHWRVVAWISFIGAILPIFMTAIWTPESPLWLIYKGQDAKALKSLKFLKNSKYGLDAQTSFNEMKMIKEKKDLLINKDLENVSVFQCIAWQLSKPTVFKPALLMIIFFALQQFTGIYTFQFHAVKMLQEVTHGINIKLATLAFGTFRFILSFVATGVVHKYGRRPLCILSGIVMGITLFISGLCFHYRTSGYANLMITWTPLICMLLYISAGSIGIMLIPWIMPSEMFPTEVKGLLIGPIMGWCNTIMFVAVHFYDDFKRILGGMLGILWLYSFISILTVLFVWIFIPETHIMKLSEIEDYFKDNTVYLLRKKKIVKKEQLIV